MPRPRQPRNARGQFMSVQVTGVETVRRNLRGLQRATANEIGHRAMMAGGLILLREARRRAPVHTGYLKKRIRLKKPPVQKPDSLLFHVRSNAPHSYLVGFGNTLTRPRRHKSGKSTGNMPPNRFMSEAADAVESRVQAEIERVLWNGMRRWADTRSQGTNR